MAEKVLKQEISAEDKQFNRNKWLFGVSGIGRDMSYQLSVVFAYVHTVRYDAVRNAVYDNKLTYRRSRACLGCD